MTELSAEKAIILIVDDQPTNLSSLLEFLDRSGFKVWVARNGQSALKKVEYSPPDLILMDGMMPEMDGFETCRRLKENESTKDIPVIFMTALNDTQDKVKGFNVGAVDYITKPIQHEEVLARLKTHLSIRNLTKKLKQEISDREFAQTELENLTLELEQRVQDRTGALSASNYRLKQEIKERHQAERALQKSLKELQFTQSQLIQSEKMSALGQMVAGIAHEINNPVNFIYGNLDYVREHIRDVLRILDLYQRHYPVPVSEIQEEAEAIDLEFVVDDLPNIMNSMQVGAERIREIVLNLRNFARKDGVEMKSVNIHEGIDSTLMILQNRFKCSPEVLSIEAIKEYCPDFPPVECFSGEVNQVFMNLLANAIDALDEYNQGRSLEEIKANPSKIWIRTQMSDRDTAIIKIADNGPGMPDDVRHRVFDPFFTTKPPGKGTGIGLSISWHIVVEKHGGKFWCNSVLGEGTEFAIELPLRQKKICLERSMMATA